MSVGRAVSVGGLMLTLAAIDFAAALVAKDFADRRRISALLVGCGLQIVLFLVYAVALRIAELSIVTMGWIVLLQVALIATDVTQNGLRLNLAQWSAVGLVIVLQVFLVATTDGQTHTTAAYEKRTGAVVPYPAGSAETAAGQGGPDAGQTSTGLPGRSPVTRNTTRRATDTAWSANRS